jgi:hypothetical protein
MIRHWQKCALQLATCAVLIIVDLSFADAAQIIQTRDYRVVGNVIVPVDLAFDQFNPQLGALSDAEFTFQFEVRSASIDFENIGSTPRSANVEIGNVVNYLGPGLVLDSNTAVFDSVYLFHGVVDFAAFDGSADFMGSDAFNFRQITPVGHGLSAIPTSFAAYVGTASVPLQVTGIIAAGISGLNDPNIRINGDELIGAVTLRYAFAPTAIPEPYTFSLIAVGLLICFAYIRRTSKLPSQPSYSEHPTSAREGFACCSPKRQVLAAPLTRCATCAAA